MTHDQARSGRHGGTAVGARVARGADAAGTSRYMRITARVVSTVLIASLAGVPSVASSQEPQASAGAPAAPAITQQDLDRMLAPIALYPDALIAQILMAATYPLEVVEAARWSKANPSMKGKALEDAMQKQSWDPSVKALTAVPQVLSQMNDNLAWMQKLGDAFLADQKAVLATVQSLREKAQAAGNLKSTPEQTVTTDRQDGKTVYVIESPKTEVIYVPTYNPSTVYGTWWYPVPPNPPYYLYPPTYVYPPGLVFATGVIVGAAIWGRPHWHGGYVHVSVNHYNSFNRTNINNVNWNHNIEHRRGVAYKDPRVAQRYNRATNPQIAQSRERYRGRVDTADIDRGPSTNDVRGNDARPNNRGPQADRGPATNDVRANDRGNARGPSTADRSGRADGGGGFSGIGNASETREASSRGAASRESMKGGGKRRR